MITFQIVCIAWVFFRATSFSNAWAMFASMIHNWGMASPLITSSVLPRRSSGLEFSMCRAHYMERLTEAFGRLHPVVMGVRHRACA